MSQKLNRIGEKNKNKFGNLMIITKYINNADIVVDFIGYNYQVKTSYYYFKNGKVYCPFDKNVYGVGYLGLGKYNSVINGENSFIYSRWQSILKRCYTNNEIENPTYKGCTVCEEWLNFQNFAEWYEDNYYEIENEKMQIDKDILHKGNKIYSPETCVFVPARINYLFTKNNKNRGNLPIGVYYDDKINKYIASYNKLNKHVHIGCYDDSIEAFESYKKIKEKYIKEIAEEYKDKIPQKLYDALYKYQVEITD